MRIAAALIAAFVAAPGFAKLPPPSEQSVVQAAETAAKGAWNDRVAQYRLCLAMERVADGYRTSLAAAGKDVPPPVATAPCADPGPYVSPVAASRPLEAAGAHSPPEVAVAPPNTKATAAELSTGARK